MTHELSISAAFRRLAVAALLLLAAAQTPTLASGNAGLGAPSGQIVLSVVGESVHGNRAGAADFDRDMLDHLPRTTVETETEWTDGVQRFEGVLLKDILDAVGIHEPCDVRAVALNDYVIGIPADDMRRTDVLVADRHNGEPMAIRNKGPLWIIYPDSSGVEDRADKMIWQLRTLEVLD